MSAQSPGLKYVGRPADAVDGMDKITGTCMYVGDYQLPGMLHAGVLRSPVPHARIVRLDVEPALRVPGVVAAITCDDFHDHGNFFWPIKDRYMLAYRKVCYVGDAIAAVAAETAKAAQAGVQAIELELEELPGVFDPEKALELDAPQIPLTSPTGQGNLVERLIVRNGEPQPILAGCPVVYDETFQVHHQEHAYLEPEAALAIPHEDGSLTVYYNGQSPFINQDNLSLVLGLPPDRVRVVQAVVGGSFGGKDDIGYQSSGQVAALALKSGRPVRLVLTREESFVASYKREAARFHFTLGTDAAGNLQAAKVAVLADSGGYASMTTLAMLRAGLHAAGPYRYQAVHVDVDVVYTNNGFSGAFRGFGNTDATAAIEQAIDELAHRLGRDPLDFRLQSCVRQGDRLMSGNTVTHEVGLADCLNWVRQRSEWDRKRAAYGHQQGDLRRGIGVACYMHGCSLGGEGADYAHTTLQVERDYSITLTSGLTDYGQGSRTVFTLIAAETLGVQPTRIRVLRPDTDTALESGPTVASRSTMVGGNATRVAAQKLDGLLVSAAAHALQCASSQVTRYGERYIADKGDEYIPLDEYIPWDEYIPFPAPAGSPDPGGEPSLSFPAPAGSPDPGGERSLSFEEVVDHARQMGLVLSVHGSWSMPHIEWDLETGTGTPYYAYTFGAQVAEVEVDVRTGQTAVLKVWAAHDGGKIIFPQGAAGQMFGGIAQGLGYGLLEEMNFDRGYPQALNFDTYMVPTALDVPEIEHTFIEAHFPEGPYGAKNLAEPVLVATAPAIANAVFCATGRRLREIPLTLERVLLGRGLTGTSRE